MSANSFRKHALSSEWAKRQRLTNKLVRFCFEYLVKSKRVNAETIHALCRLTWITNGGDQQDSPSRLSATKIPALETIFRNDYSQVSLDDIARDIHEKSGVAESIVKPLIAQYTGFTNFYNAYRNSSLDWIRTNHRAIQSILAKAHKLESDNDGAVIAAEIGKLSNIPAPNRARSTHPEYLLTPVCFCLDSRIRFPIINGSNNVTTLLREFKVFNAELVDKFSVLVALLGRNEIDDAADLDQLRSWDASAVSGVKKQYKLVIKKSKDLALKDQNDYEVLKKNLTVKAKRIHNELTNKLLKSFENKIIEGSDPQCRYDALIKNYDGECDLLIEVKSSIDITDVRMAIGQLLDYQRQLDNRDNTHRAVLLPKEPSQNVKDLLKFAEMNLLWFKGEELLGGWW